MEGFVPFALFHVPARRLRAEVDLNHDDKRRDGSRSQHPTPLRVDAEEVGSLECDRDDAAQFISAVTVPLKGQDSQSEHDAERGPHLPPRNRQYLATEFKY